MTSATVFTYMPGPITLGAFRNHLPGLKRPFHLPVAAVLSPLAFVASTLLIYWSGWSVNEILVPILMVAWIGYAIFGKKNSEFQQDLRCAWWLLAYYIAILVISMLGSYGGSGIISSPLDMILTIVAALVCYFWGVKASLPKPDISDDEEDTPTSDLPVSKKYAAN
jgi:hypothetical protein